MSIFARPHYMSDATQFINQLKTQRPELDAQQVAGRALLWDKPGTTPCGKNSTLPK